MRFCVCEPMLTPLLNVTAKLFNEEIGAFTTVVPFAVPPPVNWAVMLNVPAGMTDVAVVSVLVT